MHNNKYFLWTLVSISKLDDLWNKLWTDNKESLGFKYRTHTSQGLLQLEVLRAKHNDSGVYMIVAENEAGKATIESNIIIKEPKDHFAK